MWNSRATVMAAIVLSLSFGQTHAADPVALQKTTWKIGSETREALLYAPTGSNKPVIFAWHGHGGTAAFAARKFAFHTLWPDAIVVYPQGLPTPAPLVDPEGKRSGWQKYVGDQDDRDLKFYDAMLKTLRAEHSIDDSRVFSAGHSNGGFFTYLLASARGDTLAAIAPVAATITPRMAKGLKPKPVLHVAGEKDPLVKYTLQERSIEEMRKLNQCDPTGRPAGKNCIEYRSKEGPPVVAFLHSGGHEIPEEAPSRIVEFFKDQSKIAIQK